MNYYDYDYSYGYEAAESASSMVGGVLAFFGFYMLFLLAISIFMIVCNWKVFKKAGKNGWEAIIPIYNIIVLIEIAGLPLWYIALFFVPFANIYALFKIYIELAHKFGQSTGFGVAMVFFSIICLPILAFGNSKYQGNISAEPINNGYNPNQPVNPMPVSGYENQAPQNVMSSQPLQNQVAPQNVMPSQPLQNQVGPQNTFMFNEPVEQPVTQPVQTSQQPINIFNGQIPVAPSQPSEPVQPVAQEATPVNPVMPNVTDIPNPNVEQVKYCPNCGNKTAMTADTCFMCGHKF